MTDEKEDRTGCDACGWSGVIEQANGVPRECECGIVRRLAHSMPDYVRRAKVVRAHLDTVLYSRPKAMTTNLYVHVAWDDMCAILQALMIRHMNKPVFVINDGDVKSVYVGSKSKSSRSDDFKGPIYNDLQDLMGFPGLMILKLNEAKGANKALPRALEEALTYRLNYARPLWLVSDPEHPFDKQSVGWSDESWNLIARRCLSVKIPQILPREVPQIREWDDVAGSPLAPELMKPIEVSDPPRRQDPPKVRPTRKQRREDDESDVDPALSVYGSGVPQGRSFKGRG